jgi:hypothetical protein
MNQNHLEVPVDQLTRVHREILLDLYYQLLLVLLVDHWLPEFH